MHLLVGAHERGWRLGAEMLVYGPKRGQLPKQKICGEITE
jgi:hypothetical protein